MEQISLKTGCIYLIMHTLIGYRKFSQWWGWGLFNRLELFYETTVVTIPYLKYSLLELLIYQLHQGEQL